MTIEGSFNDLEILKLAISMEEEGMKFYTQGARHAQGKLRDFLLHAAGQELLHRDKFQRIYENIVSRTVPNNDDYLFDAEVAAYLTSLVKDQVFVDGEESESAFKDLKSAARHALRNENTTVELYTKMHQGAKYGEVKKLLEDFIEEEKVHVQYFKELLEDLEAGT